MRKRYIVPAIIMAAATSISGCQKSPDSSIVKNKDFDNMIEQAGNTKNGSKNVDELAGEYDTYQTTVKNDSLHVTVNVDAKVDIPKTNQMSVLHVKQKTIDQAFLDKVKKELAGDTKLYDGSILSIQTRSSIEAEIKELKAQIADLDGQRDEYDADSIKQMKSEYQNIINDLQKDYESAPSEPVWADYASDGKIHAIKKMYEKNSQDGFYSWAHDLNPSGEIYYGVSDGKDDNYTALFVQNSADYGNCIRFSRDRHGYAHVTSAVADDSCNGGAWKIEDGFSENSTRIADISSDDLIEYTDVSATMTQEQAKDTAEQLLGKLGLTDFQYYDGDLYGEIVDSEPNSDGKFGYRKVYILKYLRNINGVFVSNDGGSKFTDEWQGDSYVKQLWAGESIQVIINDDGIVGFYYSVPIEITDTVVEQSSMKSFDEIKDIFEQMIVVTNARQDADNANVTIDIDRVMLRYTRISEPDNFDTGLLVPVWDFYGNLTTSYVGEPMENSKENRTNTCMLTINAIDGTVIDRELGY